MVISLSVITKKDAQLALVWRLATMRNSKLSTIKKRNVLEHNVRKSCKAIVSMIEKSVENREMLSLYLMAQLVYGTTILFSRQVEFLFADANSLVAFVKNHYLQLVPGVVSKKDAKKRKGKNDEDDYQTPKKRSKKNMTEDEDSKFLSSQARPDMITIREELPVMNNNYDINLIDDLVPLTDADFNNMYQSMSHTFTDFQKSSGNEEIEQIRNADSFLNENLIDLPEIAIQPPDVEILQQSMTTPVKVYSNERFEPAPGLGDILTMGFENLRAGKANDSMDLDEELEHMKRASMNHPADDVPYNKPQQFPSLNFELSEISPEDLMLQTPFKTPSKRRRCSDTQITHAEMREMQNDYDSLLQPIGKFKVKISKPYELSLKELMDPMPVTVIRGKMAQEISEMYRKIGEKGKFDPNIGTWISEEEEEERSEVGTAKSRNNLPMVELDMENLKYLSTPIKPERTPPSTPRQNFEQEEFQIPRASPLNITPLNDIEFGIQQGFSDEVNNVISPLNSQPTVLRNTALGDIPGSEIREKIVEVCKKRAPFSGCLDDVVDYNDGKRMAARTFYVLLEMAKEQIIKVHEQSAPFAKIEFNLKTEESSDDEDIEDVVTSENNKGFIASSGNSQE